MMYGWRLFGYIFVALALAGHALAGASVEVALWSMSGAVTLAGEVTGPATATVIADNVSVSGWTLSSPQMSNVSLNAGGIRFLTDDTPNALGELAAISSQTNLSYYDGTAARTLSHSGTTFAGVISGTIGATTFTDGTVGTAGTAIVRRGSPQLDNPQIENGGLLFMDLEAPDADGELTLNGWGLQVQSVADVDQNVHTTLFSAIADSTAIANTTTETRFDNTDDIVISANTARVGDTIKVFAAGVYSTSGTPTLTIRIRLRDGGGNTTQLTLNGVTTANNAVDNGWSVESTITIRDNDAAGATTAVTGMAINGADIALRRDTATPDFTENSNIEVSVVWGTASASNSITCSIYHVRLE
jgi:hypothetical protein